jgi:hypothetical protein
VWNFYFASDDMMMMMMTVVAAGRGNLNFLFTFLHRKWED